MTHTTEKTNKISVGDIVKAYDFEPRPEIGDRYVVGRVLEVEDVLVHIEVLFDTCYPMGARETIKTGLPGSMAFGEWEGRLTVLDGFDEDVALRDRYTIDELAELAELIGGITFSRLHTSLAIAGVGELYEIRDEETGRELWTSFSDEFDRYEYERAVREITDWQQTQPAPEPSFF